MTASRTRIVAAALMIGGLVVAAVPMSAAAHTGKLYTWMFQEVEPQQEYLSGFAELSQADASAAFLGAQNDLTRNAAGADICTNGDAWGSFDMGRGNPATVFTWNHDTGEVGPTAPLTMANPGFFADAVSVAVQTVYSADSLADCTKLVYGLFSVVWEPAGEPESLLALSSIDPSTGAVTAILGLTQAADGQQVLWHGIATDPVSGLTYLFYRFADDPYSVVLDLAVPAVSEGVLMEGLQDTFEEGGQVLEADFQPDGKLWMLYESNIESSDVKLLSFAPGADLATADPTAVGSINDDPATGPFNFNVAALTYDPHVLPATGAAPTGLLVVGGALILAGIVLAASRVRPRAVHPTHP